MSKKNKSQKVKAKDQPHSIPTTAPSQEKPQNDLPTPPYDKPEAFSETDFPPLPHSPVTEAVPKLGNRHGTQDLDETAGEVGSLAKGSASGLKPSDVTDTGKKEDDKGSLQIKIHLDLHAQVKLELDARVYGDIVIGLL